MTQQYHGLSQNLVDSQRAMGIDPLTQKWMPGWGPSGYSFWREIYERYGLWFRVAGWVISLVLAIVLVIIRSSVP